MRRLTPFLSLLLSVSLFTLAALPAAAQSAESIAEKMKARYQEQLENVDNYIVETNMYTTYHRKIMEEGTPALETEVRMKGQSSIFTSMGNTQTTNSSEPAYYEDLSQNATYDGSETVNGVECHVLRVKDASEMEGNAQEMTYYVNTEQYVPMRLKSVQPPQQGGGKPTEVEVNFEDYRTTKGITLPWRTTMQMNMEMSEEQRQRMKKMMKQLENLPKSQREMMKKQMPMAFDRMKKILQGEPTTIEVQDVRVNTDMPEGMFDSSTGGR
jgi:hypothetical protein